MRVLALAGLLPAFAACGGGGGSGGSPAGGGGSGGGTSAGPAGATIWASGGDLKIVRKISYDTGLELGQVPVNDTARSLAMGAGSVWVVVGDNTIVRIDPATLTITATIPAGDMLSEIAFGAGALWVCAGGLGTSANHAELLRLDPGNNQAVAVPMATNVTESGMHVEVTDSSVYLSALPDSMLTRVDPGSATVIAQLKVGGAKEGFSELAAGSGRLVGGDYGADSVFELDPQSLATTNTESGITDMYVEPAVIGPNGNFYVTDNDADTLLLYEGGGLTGPRDLKTNGQPQSIAFARGAMFVGMTSATGSGIRVIDPDTGALFKELPLFVAEGIAAE